MTTRARATATIMVVALLAATLTACISNGNREIRDWLNKQPLVSSVTETGGYNGFTYLPNFTIALRSDAGDSAIREFAHAVGGMLSSKDPGKNAKVNVAQGGIQFSIARVRATTEAIVSDWLTLRADPRITGGYVSEGQAAVDTEKQLMTAVYREHFSPQRSLETTSPDAQLGVFEWDPSQGACSLGEVSESPALDLAEQLLADPVFEYQSLELCAGFTLLVSDTQQVPAAAEGLRLLLASSPAELPSVSLSPRGSATNDNLLITGASAGELRAITGLLGAPGIAAVGRNANGLTAETSNTASMTNLLSTLSQHPDAAALSGITVRYASNGLDTRDTISSASVAGAIAQLDTITAVLAAGQNLGWTFSSDTEFRVFLAEKDYTPELVESVAFAVHARGVGAERSLLFGLPLNWVSVQIVDNRVTEISGQRENLRPRAEHLSAYWESLNG